MENVVRLPRMRDGSSLLVPLSLWQSLVGRKPPLILGEDGFHTLDSGAWTWDGCTASPDRVWCWDLRPACCIHDWEKAATSRYSAFKFYRNLYKCVRFYGGSRFNAMWVGLTYSTLVVPGAKLRSLYRRIVG